MKFLEYQMQRDSKQNGGCLRFNGYRVSVWENEKVVEVYDGDGCTTK